MEEVLGLCGDSRPRLLALSEAEGSVPSKARLVCPANKTAPSQTAISPAENLSIITLANGRSFALQLLLLLLNFPYANDPRGGSEFLVIAEGLLFFDVEILH
jgi:hypothetical protein